MSLFMVYSNQTVLENIYFRKAYKISETLNFRKGKKKILRKYRENFAFLFTPMDECFIIKAKTNVRTIN